MADGEQGGRANEVTFSRGGEDYVLHQEGESLRVGQQLDGQVQWLDVDVPLTQLGGEARRAWEDGDQQNPALVIALDGIITAAADRGA